jgi:hypothetical protein
MLDTGLEHVDDDEADDRRECADDLEVDERIPADSPDLFISSMPAMPATTVQKTTWSVPIR